MNPPKEKDPATIGVAAGPAEDRLEKSTSTPRDEESADEVEASSASRVEQSASSQDQSIVWRDDFTAAEAAAYYIARGWSPLPLKAGDKKPLVKNWQNASFRAADFGAGANIGIHLGERSDSLVDIDLDIPEARAFADEMLFHLPGFGRRGAKNGHRLVRCTNAPDEVVRFTFTGKAARFAADRLTFGVEGNKAMVLELRCSAQTMFPPSVHPSSERITWSNGAPPRELPNCAWEDLQRMAGLTAFAAVMIRAYPTEGGRDNCCLAISGTLAHFGWEAGTIDRVVSTIAKCANDEEWQKRGKGGRAAARVEDGAPTTGLPGLLKLLELEPLEKTLREWLGQTASEESLPADAIVLRAGALAEVVDQIEQKLLAADSRFYHRGNRLVHVVRQKALPNDLEVKRQPDASVILPVSTDWLLNQMSRKVRFYKRVGAQHFPCDPDPKYANNLLSRNDEWQCPELRGVLRAPTITANGRLLQKPGYDADTGLLLDFAEDAFPCIPEEPTRDEALAAIAKLEAPFREYRFVSDAARSVPVAAILTGLVRSSLATAPLFVFDAPTAGSGKGKLVSSIGIVVLGFPPPSMNQGKSDEESEKRLSSALLKGDRALVVDNCVHALEGDFLCTMLTQGSVQIRVLGRSQSPVLSTDVLVMANGNNMCLSGDINRRSIISRIDPGVERPDEKEYSFDPVIETTRKRTELVVAGLTVLRAFDVAGRPKQKLKPFGSFEDWDWIRGAMTWLGRADPFEARAALTNTDDKRGEVLDLLHTWYAALKSRPVRLNEIQRNMAGLALGTPDGRLYAALCDFGAGRWNAKAIGKNLLTKRDQIVGGLALRCIDDNSHGNRYWVEVVNPDLLDMNRLNDAAQSYATVADNTEMPF